VNGTPLISVRVFSSPVGDYVQVTVISE